MAGSVNKVILVGNLDAILKLGQRKTEIKLSICHSRHLSVGKIRIQASKENVLNGTELLFSTKIWVE